MIGNLDRDTLTTKDAKCGRALAPRGRALALPACARSVATLVAAPARQGRALDRPVLALARAPWGRAFAPLAPARAPRGRAFAPLALVLVFALILALAPAPAQAQTLNSDSSGWRYETTVSSSTQSEVHTQIAGLAEGGYAVVLQRLAQGTTSSYTTDVISTAGQTASFGATDSAGGIVCKVYADTGLVKMQTPKYSSGKYLYGLARADGTVVAEATYLDITPAGTSGKWAVGATPAGNLQLISLATGKVSSTVSLPATSSCHLYCAGNYVVAMATVHSNGFTYPGKLMKITSTGWKTVLSFSNCSMNGDDFAITTTGNVAYALTGEGKLTKIGAVTSGQYAAFSNGLIAVDGKFFMPSGKSLSWYTGSTLRYITDNRVCDDRYIYDANGATIASIPASSSGSSTSTYSSYVKGTYIIINGSDGRLSRIISGIDGSAVPASKYSGITSLGAVEGGKYYVAFVGGTLLYYDSALNRVPSYTTAGTLAGSALYVTKRTYGSAPIIVDRNGYVATIGSYTIALPVTGDSVSNRLEESYCVTANGGTVYFATNAAGKYGAVTADGTVVIPFEYDTYYAQEDLDFALVCKNGVWGFWQFGADTTDIAEATVSNLKSTYAETGAAIVPGIKVTCEGKTLVKGTDYVVSCKNNVRCGTATIAISGIGDYSGVLTKTFTIKPSIALSSVSLSVTSYTYNGKAHCPVATVTYNGTKLTKGTDYTVTLPSGRTKVGVYTITFAGKGSYTGTTTKTYRINPQGTSVSKLTAASKGFTVKWAKQATQTTGYQVRYATNDDMTGALTKTVASNTTTSLSVTGRKAKTTYYVQVRTYKKVTVGTKVVTCYSSWSAAKKVTTKA